MTFTVIDYENFENEILAIDRTIKRNIYNKLATIDATECQQMILLLSKFGDLALSHKKEVLNAYKEVINGQIDLIKSYLAIVEAGAGNISPAGNITGLLTVILNFINVGTLQATLGTYQGEMLSLSRKPLFAYISEIAQATEDIYSQNLSTAYNTLQNAYIMPHKVLR